MDEKEFVAKKEGFNTLCECSQILYWVIKWSFSKFTQGLFSNILGGTRVGWEKEEHLPQCWNIIMVPLALRKNCSLLYNSMINTINNMTETLKSLVILALWLALTSVIYSQTVRFHSLNCENFFPASETALLKQHNQLNCEAFFKEINQIVGKWENFCIVLQTSSLYWINKMFERLQTLVLSDWILQFQNRCVGFQIKLVMYARLILKSRELFQTKLHSTQFSYYF